MVSIEGSKFKVLVIVGTKGRRILIIMRFLLCLAGLKIKTHLHQEFFLMNVAIYFRVINTQFLPASAFFTNASTLEFFDRTFFLGFS